MTQQDLPPPSSFRNPFPLTQRDPGTRSFVDFVVRSAMPSRILPIEVTQNRLETRSLIREIIVRQEHTSEPRFTGRGSIPSAITLENEEIELIVFTDGDHIPVPFQMTFASMNFNHLRVIAFVSRDPAHNPGNMNETQSYWRKEFLERSARMAVWPAWTKRDGDRHRIIQEIHSRLSMPPGRLRPELSPGAIECLVTKPFTGVDEVETEIKRALTEYIRDNRRGPLRTAHFLGPQQEQVLTERRSVPPS